MSRQEKIQDLHFDAVLPCHLLLNQEIESSAKVFYGIVRNLTKTEGYCYAKNDYLSDLMSVDERTIQRWIKSLCEAGYLEVEYENKSINPQRFIHIVDNFKKCLRSDKNVVPVRQKCRSIDKEDILKEDSDKEEVFSSSSSPTPSNEKSNSEKEEMMRMMKDFISFTDEEFEEAYRKYQFLDKAKIPHPKAWFAKVIENSRIKPPKGIDEAALKRDYAIKNRKIAEQYERKFPKSANPDFCVICLDECVLMKSGEHEKRVRYDCNVFEWEQKTGWGYQK